MVNNRSPSPMKPNPNTRILQEKEGFGARKSFHGYPFVKSTIVAQPKNLTTNTPANSPAEYTRTISFGREYGIPFQDNEHKENEKDPNSKIPARVRSPSLSKGTKNFMSPTISATSKINSSPRKKVLGERNEPIRTSASLSEGKFHFFSGDLLDFNDENDPKEQAVDLDTDLVVLSPELPLNSAKSCDSLPLSDMPKVASNEDLGLDVKDSVAPLDADPSVVPPYDPKTNFLSPRPRFLYYKPESKIESSINFEYDLGSHSTSETESSEVETSSVEEKSSCSNLGSMETEELDEPKMKARSWFGGKWKAFCLILFMLVFLMNSQIYRNPILDFELVGENFNAVVQNAKVWSVQSVGILSKMLCKEVDVKFSPLPINNFTGWLEKDTEDSLLREFKKLDCYEAEKLEQVSGFLPFDELTKVVESEEAEEDYIVEDEEVSVELTKELESEEAKEEYILEDSMVDEFQKETLEERVMLEDAIETIEEASFVNEPENREAHHYNEEHDLTSLRDDSRIDLVVDDEQPSSIPQGSEEVQSQLITTIEPISDTTSKRNIDASVTAVGLIVVSILVATGFMVVKKAKSETSSMLVMEKSIDVPVVSKIDPNVHENSPCVSGQVEVDMGGEPCPSEFSSFQKTSSCNKNKDSDEAQSIERYLKHKYNHKRESLASSSDNAITSSYGSYTTYSVLPSKQGDDELVTPVRRSSRIRSKVTSP
ncbi:uncharacterized protein LOC130806362 [Amaranthus tricolor]|uniref:uncharacterized protein LOC130806362 n=1 Tax=Amaranthus tricolor TaxID=29722 RepID=UPI00258958D3|nr:uncharacterized protein LOC130806362 [Amaranthus tricolor]